MNKIIVLLVLFITIPALFSPVYAAYKELSKTKLFGPVGENASQYSPWIMHEPGWGSYVMYYCKNTPLNGVYRDRVWRIENWNDGISGDWINDTPVIEGTLHQNDDLSCSPGVVIGPDGKWHMYYITADRDSGCNVYIYHAVANSPGLNWTKLGPLNINGKPMDPIPNCAAEVPSPFYFDNKFVLYYLSNEGLVRWESSDGNNFVNKIVANVPFTIGGRVTRVGNTFYLIFGRNTENDPYKPTDQVWIASSTDGLTFTNPFKLFSSNGTDWDGGLAWGGDLIYDYTNKQFRIYYAGNLGTYPWFGSNTSIGVRIFESISSRPGDLNNSGHVDIYDYNILVSNFGHPYTIFDYNELVTNFGK